MRLVREQICSHYEKRRGTDSPGGSASPRFSRRAGTSPAPTWGRNGFRFSVGQPTIGSPSGGAVEQSETEGAPPRRTGFARGFCISQVPPRGRGRAPPLHRDGTVSVLRRGDFQTARRSQSYRRGLRPRRMQKAAQLPHVFRVLRSFSILLKEIRSRISGCSARNTRRSDGSASPAGR